MFASEAERMLRQAAETAGRLAERLEPYFGHAALGLLCVLLLVLISLRLQRRARRRTENRLRLVTRSLNSVQPDKSLEQNLNSLLEVVGTVVEAESYAFYTYDARNGVYVLKAVRHRTKDFGKIRPSYSGLKPFSKESYTHPLSVPEREVGESAEVVRDGDVPLIQLPVGSRLGVIRFGPMGGRLKKTLRFLLNEIGSAMASSLGFMMDKEKAILQAEVMITSGRALEKISHIALDPNATLQLMLKLSARTVGASG